MCLLLTWGWRDYVNMEWDLDRHQKQEQICDLRPKMHPQNQDPGQYTKKLDTEIGHFGHFRKIYCQTSWGIYPEIHGIVFSWPIESIEYDSAGVSFGDYLETLNISILGAVLDAIFVRTQYLSCWCIARGPAKPYWFNMQKFPYIV